MHRYVFLASVAAAFMITPAAAEESQKTAAAKPDKQKQICRRVVTTGSVMTKTTCRTKAEWDAISEAAQRDRTRMQDMDRARSAVGGD